MPNIDQQIRTRDGRTLAFAEYGASDGRPIFHVHGSPGSRLELTLFDGIDELLKRHNLRAIAIDRPGMGKSDFHPGRRVLDFPQDLIQVAEHLNIDRFGLLGLSAGAPYSFAVAHTFPERLTATVIVSGVCSFTLPGAWEGAGSSGLYFRTAKIHPWLTRALIRFSIRTAGESAPEQQRNALPPADWEIFSKPGMFRRLIDALFVEGSRQGTRGLAYEARLLWQPWGFELSEIQVPVTLWHGTADRNAPLIQGEYNAQALPNANLIIKEDEGHFSLMVNYAEEIYSQVSATIGAASTG